MVGGDTVVVDLSAGRVVAVVVGAGGSVVAGDAVVAGAPGTVVVVAGAVEGGGS